MEDYDNPCLHWFMWSVVVLLVDAATFGVLTLWEKDTTHITAIAVGGLLISSAAMFMHRLGITPASWWRKVAPPLAAAATHKPWWLSKTLIFNSTVGALLLAEANITSLQGFLPPNKYQLAAFGLPIINMLLRAYTTKGLSLKTLVPQGATQ